jgi:hypothetical protein
VYIRADVVPTVVYKEGGVVCGEVVCGVWCVVCGVWCVVCGVCCMVCCVCCVLCAVCFVTVIFKFHGMESDVYLV